MSRRAFTGFMFQSPVADGVANTGPGTFAYDTATVVRNAGSTSVRITTTAQGQTYISTLFGAAVTTGTIYARSYGYFSSYPSVRTGILEIGSTGGGQWCDASINTDGTVNLETQLGVSSTSGTVLSTNTWYRFEMAFSPVAAGDETVEIRVYAGDSTTPLITSGPTTLAITTTGIGYIATGSLPAATNTWDVYLADFAINDNGGVTQNSWVGPSRTVTLLPVAAGTAGTAEANWTKPGGGTTSKWTSVDNIPPVYAADSTVVGSAESFLRNATAASSDVTLACTDYATAGIGVLDTINLVQPFGVLGSSSTTAKTGTLGMPSNPTIAQANVAYPTTVASSTATTWARRASTVAVAPSVTLGTQPQIRLNRPATAAGTAMVNALGVLVDVTPGVATATPSRRTLLGVG